MSWHILLYHDISRLVRILICLTIDEETFPMANRSSGRNVFIYDARDLDSVLGGLILTNGVTNANLYAMIEIFLIINQDYFLQYNGTEEVAKDEQALRPGSYYIVTDGKITHTCSSAGAEFKQAASFRIASPGWFVPCQ